MKTTLPLLMMLAACGGSHVIGRDLLPDGGTMQCVRGSCGQDETCDFDAVCRSWCGSNYPNVVCPAGTVCAADICRPACTAATGSCASGATCNANQTPAGVVYACGPHQCTSAAACGVREACVRNSCQGIGALCPNGTCNSIDQICDQGVCRVPCGPNYPNNFCASGTTCQNALCR